MSQRVLLVDLNNFSRYPTIPIGYLAAIARAAGMTISVFSPLTVGVKGVVREAPVKPWSLAVAKMNYRAATMSSGVVRGLRKKFAARSTSELEQQHQVVVAEFERLLLRDRPDAVLISTYLMYRDLTATLTGACQRAGVPALVGGPYFSQPEVVNEWIDMPGLSGLVCGEVEPELPAIIHTMIEGKDLSQFAGVFVNDAGTPRGRFAAPLKKLDDVPYPDYTDFPWDKYPNRIVPIITGRGCAWGACTFCSDVTSTAGRSFRSRSVENVLGEIELQYQRHAVQRFVFTDLKLNSHVDMWRGVIKNIQRLAPGAEWISAVHVGVDRDNGLSKDELLAAAASGCLRLTTGLESGSQAVLDRMHKGTRVERTSQFLHDATAAGISTRCTMILGYPGETADDVIASANFRRNHAGVIERVSLNRLQLMTGTGLHRMIQRAPADFPGLTQVTINHRLAQLDHQYAPATDRAYRHAAMRLLEAVHAINERPLGERAREFEGVM